MDGNYLEKHMMDSYYKLLAKDMHSEASYLKGVSRSSGITSANISEVNSRMNRYFSGVSELRSAGKPLYK